MQVRQGRVVSAEWGRLSGNGAFLTMAMTRDLETSALESFSGAAGNVTLSLPAVERLVAALPASRDGYPGDEEIKLEQAVHLLYQFRRKEAGALLVEILRANRFYYPAWLWHSRLMTRVDYIHKALNEAKKWGNADRDIQHEAARIEPLLEGLAAGDSVKRCIFCWTVVQEKDDRCPHCRALFQVTDQKISSVGGTPDLEKALSSYEKELSAHPNNPRIAYCLCLGWYSLGGNERAIEYIDRALKIMPREPLFARTRALLHIPAKKPVPPPPKPAPPLRPVPASVPRKPAADKTILVVEDSQTSRKVITMLLDRKGYAILEAKNGSEALAILAEEVPDLVLLDLMLPDMSGYEILARIRQSGKIGDIPVIMLTGKSNPADRMKGLHHGSNEYLTKPFDPARLLTVLEKYLDQPASRPKEPVKAPPKAVAGIVAERPRMPRPPPRPAPVAVKPASPAPAASAGVSSKKSILVVEDSPTSRRVISMVIAKRGYTVNEAATGAVAMRKAQEGIPDLILLDAMLPDMSGYDILHRFKCDERLKNVPVVMLTARNNPVDRQKGLRGGSSAYLTKPFDPEKLLAVIDEYIR